MKKNKQNESCAQPETTVTFGLINDLIISLQNCSNCRFDQNSQNVLYEYQLPNSINDRQIDYFEII